MKRVILTAGLALGLALPALAQGALPQPIYFFTDTAQPINKQNPLVIRPKGFVLFQDGQWVLERLRWTGWGSSVARATGVSSSSNDIPNAAQGKRIKTWAHVMLSSPGRFQGHEVYRCFTMTVPPPASDMHLCLGHTHGIYILESAKQSAPIPSPAPVVSSPTGFQVRLAGGFFLCGITLSAVTGEGLAAVGGAFCLSHGSRPAESNWHVANVQPNGDVTSCSEEVSMMRASCYSGQGDDPGLPNFSPGQMTAIGPFTCKVLEAGVECAVTATGKGFLITPDSLMEVGG